MPSRLRERGRLLPEPREIDLDRTEGFRSNLRCLVLQADDLPVTICAESVDLEGALAGVDEPDVVHPSRAYTGIFFTRATPGVEGLNTSQIQFGATEQ